MQCPAFMGYHWSDAVFPRKNLIELDRPQNLSRLSQSHWMKEAEPLEPSTRPLKGKKFADVAIIGGGYVGLWTALTIKAERPEARVVVLERDICGGGASGRNGGFAMSWWPKISTLMGIADKDEAIRLAVASEQAISELGQFCQDNGIDAHFVQGGWLWTATTEFQRDAWRDTLHACAKIGKRPFQNLSDEDVSRRTGSRVHLAGVYEQSNATVQPAFLARGLRKVALQRGVEIYENTAVVSLSTNAPSILMTAHGEVQAQAVVLANNAWAAAIPELGQLITPVNSTIIATEPVPERLREIGWTGGESITDSQLMVSYYRTTRDGRIVYGKGTGVIQYQSVIGECFSQSPEATALTLADFRRAFPMLRDVKIDDQWAGPIDRTYDSLPVFGTLRDAGHISYGVGWSGNGVAPSRIGGKILSALALGLRNEWSGCALVNRSSRKFPPEPFRFVGGSLVRNAVLRKEQAEALGKMPHWWDVKFAGLAPAGLEDKS